MKKLITTLLALTTAAALFGAIDKKFDYGYNYESLEVNTGQKSHNLSLYEGNTLVFMRDSGVYVAEIDTAATNLVNEKELKGLKDLGLHGTFAYNSNKKTIYFTLYEDDKNEWLYESTMTSDSTWSKPKRLVIDGLGRVRSTRTFVVNAGWDYIKIPKVRMYNPTFKDSCIYFVTEDLEGGHGGKDIWSICPKDAATWAYPQNAGDSINSEADEDYPFFDTDGTIYFTSTRDSIGQSIYSAAPGEEAAMLEDIYNGINNDYNMVIKDGVPFAISERDGKPEIFAWVQLPPPEPELEPEPDEEVIIIKFPWTFVLFDFDKFNITDRYLREIKAMAAEMNRMDASTQFVIEGHTDQRGSYEYNDKLSFRRADAVKTHLVEQGVDPSRLIVKAYGKRKPLYPNPENEEEFYQNRRVVVDVIDSEGEQVVDGEDVHKEVLGLTDGEAAPAETQTETPAETPQSKQ